MLKLNKHQTGYTLVELMVAIVLGLLLTAAVVQSYMGTRQTYRMNDGISRIQENARFANYFISKDLRDAGHNSCISRIRNKLDDDADGYLSSKASVTGWNSTNSNSGNTVTLTGATAAGTNWDNTLPSYLNGLVIAGSDVLSFKNFEALDITIADTNTASSNQIGTVGGHGVETGSILLIGNCWEAELFQHIAAGASTSLAAPNGTGSDVPGNRNLGSTPWLREYGSEDKIFALKQTIYYVGTGASGLPSLFRFTTFKAEDQIIADGDDITNSAQELVEGVESLQLLYGEDTDATLDGVPNRYVSANEVSNWDNIISVRIGLLFRSTNNVTDTDQGNYTLLDNITFTHSDDDRILRYSVNTTIKLRNSGLDADLGYYVCDAVGMGAPYGDTPACS